MASDDHAQERANGALRPVEGSQNERSSPTGGQLSAASLSTESAVDATPMNGSEQPTIVIIDDDDAVRESLRMLLEAFGYVVQDHASAQSFLTCDTGKAATLLVDQHMPGMTGIELLELLYAMPHPPPAMMLTGRADHTIEARLSRIGVKLLRKPAADDQLIALIEEIRRPITAGQTASDTGSRSTS